MHFRFIQGFDKKLNWLFNAIYHLKKVCTDTITWYILIDEGRMVDEEYFKHFPIASNSSSSQMRFRYLIERFSNSRRGLSNAAWFTVWVVNVNRAKNCVISLILVRSSTLSISSISQERKLSHFDYNMSSILDLRPNLHFVGLRIILCLWNL
jgi:hypothetical protein